MFDDTDPTPEDFAATPQGDLSWMTFPVTSGGVIVIDNIDHSNEEPEPMVEVDPPNDSIWHR